MGQSISTNTEETEEEKSKFIHFQIDFDEYK